MKFTGLKLLCLGGLLLSASAQAKQYGMAGCGLGSLVIKDDGVIQIVATTTNGTSGSQTFGITSGTSNCVRADKVGTLKMQEDFFVANLPSIVKESSQGSGETVLSFASTLGCSSDSSAAVLQALKANHGMIFSQPGAFASLDAAKDVLRANPTTASNCKDLI